MKKQVYWRKIIIKCPAADKEFKVGIEENTTVQDVMDSILKRMEDEGFDVSEWGRSAVGNANVNFIMMRTGTNAEILFPRVKFGELEPMVEDDEQFIIDVQGQVG